MCVQCTLENVLKSESGNILAYPSPSWKQACIDIRASYDNARIQFHGVVGSKYNGDVAIDDVKLEGGSCVKNTSGHGNMFYYNHTL